MFKKNNKMGSKEKKIIDAINLSVVLQSWRIDPLPSVQDAGYIWVSGLGTN